MAAKSSGKFFVWGILGLLIVAMAGFGTTNFGGSASTVATVGDEEVSANDYYRALDSEMRALSEQFGTNLDFPLAEQLGVPQSVLSQLSNRAALDAEAARASLSVGDADLRDAILAIPAFQGLNGSFDQSLYSETLRRIGLNEREFEAGLRKDTATALLNAGLVAGIQMPDSYAQTVVQWLSEERTITTVRLTKDDLITPLPTPSDKELQAFYSDNEARYTALETREITYAWLTPLMLASEVDLNEDAIREIYDANITAYQQPERRLIERLVFTDEDLASEAAARIEEGTSTFEDEVAARGLALLDADMGDVAQTALGEAGSAVFGAEIGAVVGPAPSDLGPALYRVNGILDAVEISYEDAREDIVAEMAPAAAARQILDQLESFDDLLASGATLEELAAETDMALGKISFTDLSESGIASYTAFRTAALAAQTRDYPEIIELSDGGVFAMRLDEIVPPTVKPYDEVAAEVAIDFEKEAVQKALLVQAETLETDVAAGANMTELGLTTEVYEGLNRRDFLDQAPFGFIEAVFAPGLDQGGTTVIEDDGSVLIAHIDLVVTPPQSEENATIADAYSAQAAQSAAQDVVAAFTSALIAREGISVNQAAINAVHAQMQ